MVTHLYRTRVVSISNAVTLATSNFSEISTALALALSSVLMSSWLSRMLPGIG